MIEWNLYIFAYPLIDLFFTLKLNIMQKFLFVLLTFLYLTNCQVIRAADEAGATRTQYTFEKGWKFIRSDHADFSQPDYDDSRWQSVTVPHDWAIYGPFSIQNDRQKVAITQDGQKEAMEHAGRTGGLPFVGVGWYRLDFEVPAFDRNKKATLVFDGAMSHARVYINGKEAGYWPYGYNTFYLDVTPYLNADGRNIMAVRLENEVESSRWYPGAGLYRNVHLIVNEDAHIPVWGTQLSTPVVKDDFARVHLNTSLVIPEGKPSSSYRIVTEIKNADGSVLCKEEKQLTDFDNQAFSQEFIVEKPELWTPDTPCLYTAESKVYEGNTLKDESVTPFGIRSIEIIPNKGFFLNGKKTVFKGVCNHHDLGPLGAAVNDAAIRHQIRILKDMGCNAIRTSHNMPAPELVRACDEMGMMLMVETFDEWKATKCEKGYNKIFDEWVERDLVNVLRHFRNNPSVVMWCIGNEVPDQWNGDQGPKLSRFLQDICHREDPTRPVTQGMDAPDAVINNNMAAVMDVVGLNYRPHKYPEAYKKLPQQIILGSETASTVSSRGVYKFPVVRAWMKRYDDHQASSYDVEHCGWSNLPEDDFIQHEDLPYCIGEFVWTGFDYLGEPTPYYTDWPSHSSLFGIIDLAGLPKDRYYLYRSHWNKEKETLHILPHWNWKGREGEVTPVFVYTNYPSAELFINGKSQGKRTKDLSVTVHNSADSVSMMNLKRQQRYRLMWMDTKYEPGTVKVVAYDKNGKAVAEKEIHTAGTPHHIELIPDRTILKADGKDLCFVTVRVMDKEGNLCPDAADEISFKVKGAGVYCAGANGNPASLESFQLPKMKVFSGMMTAIVQVTDQPGEIVLEATGRGLKKATLKIESK
jgi:beta-galactosidase